MEGYLVTDLWKRGQLFMRLESFSYYLFLEQVYEKA